VAKLGLTPDKTDYPSSGCDFNPPRQVTIRAAPTLAEKFDAATGRHLGNFPQAFSHLALVEAAARIIVGEGLAEVGG
jgi:hypothetical protein